MIRWKRMKMFRQNMDLYTFTSKEFSLAIKFVTEQLEPGTDEYAEAEKVMTNMEFASCHYDFFLIDYQYEAGELKVVPAISFKEYEDRFEEVLYERNPHYKEEVPYYEDAVAYAEGLAKKAVEAGSPCVRLTPEAFTGFRTTEVKLGNLMFWAARAVAESEFGKNGIAVYVDGYDIVLNPLSEPSKSHHKYEYWF